jgi:HEAT repeat protein
VSSDRIRCKRCGVLNDVTAFACSGCGTSLVGTGDDRWMEARERDRVLDADAEAAADRAVRVRRAIVIVAVVVIAGVLIVPFANWFSRNHYLRGEPLYESKPAAYWIEILHKSDDHFMRRRAALAIDTICERFNERTAREIVPELKKSLDDDDDIVRNRTMSALAKIKVATGVT